jgi:integrase
VFLERVGRRSEATRATYAYGLDAFARCFDVQLADLLVAKIKSGELDAYNTLDKFVGWLAGNGAVRKTIWIYVGSVKSLLEHEDVLLDRRKPRKVQLPVKVEVSIDWIPTREELRSLILNSLPGARALIALLASSGLRIGEATDEVITLGTRTLLEVMLKRCPRLGHVRCFERTRVSACIA